MKATDYTCGKCGKSAVCRDARAGVLVCDYCGTRYGRSAEERAKRGQPLAPRYALREVQADAE